MSAARLTDELTDTVEEAVTPQTQSGPGEWLHLHQRYTRMTMTADSALFCPHCGSVIYSRRNRLCGACSEVLPEEYLFSPKQAQQVERLLRLEREKFRRWRKRLFDRAFGSPSIS